MRKKILSITKKDFDIQTFRSGGKGGQHQNKTDSGVRIIHRESRAVGESRNYKSQLHNKKAALKRLTASSKFQLWLNRRTHEIIRGETIEQEVNRMMQPKNLKIETRETGVWVEGDLQ